jgi:hypothetical protein
MNEFLAFDDADWELASAYLDNEVTFAERAQVEASPALMGLVADLRSMQSAVASPAPAAIDRDAIIAAALAGAVDEPVVGRIAGSGGLGGELPPPLAASVTSIATGRSRRASFGRAPMLLAAALVTVMGIGFALRAGSRGNSLKTTSGAATTVAGTAKASSDQSAGVTAAAPASTESLASLPAPAGAATTAAATAAATAATTAAAATTAGAATTAAAAPATTAAPASVTTAAPVATTAAPATAVPTTATAGHPPPALTLQELRDLVVASAANPAASATLVCPDPRGVPRLSVQIVWNGQPAVVYIDQVSQTLVVLAVNGCTPVANIPIKDLAQS